MFIIDALVFLAREAFGFFFVFYYIIISLAKAFLLLMKPLWFIFWFVVSFVKTVFTATANPAVWTPDGTVVTFFQSIPMFPTLTTMVVLILVVAVTLKTIRNGFE